MKLGKFDIAYTPYEAVEPQNYSRIRADSDPVRDRSRSDLSGTLADRMRAAPHQAVPVKPVGKETAFARMLFYHNRE